MAPHETRENTGKAGYGKPLSIPHLRHQKFCGLAERPWLRGVGERLESEPIGGPWLQRNKIPIDGNPDNIHPQFYRKAPLTDTGSQKEVALRTTGKRSSERMLLFFYGLTPA
jgi:hypothetical protein